MGDVRQDQATGQETAGQEGAGEIRFYVRPANGDWDIGPQNPPGKGKAAIDFKYGDPGKDIVIRLVGAAGNVKFNTADPVWIEENGTCPPKQGNNCPDQVYKVACTDTVLTLHDTNTRACNIKYQLNFIGAGPCDPDIRNGGGGGIA